MQQRFIANLVVSGALLPRTKGGIMKYFVSMWFFCPEFISAFIP